MAARMKVAFAGTPEFAREALAAILAAGFDVPGLPKASVPDAGGHLEAKHRSARARKRLAYAV